MEVYIDKNGAVHLGRTIVCDAYAPKSIRVITHAHADHLYGLKESIENCDCIYATPPTLKIINLLKGIKGENLRSLDYFKTQQYQQVKFTFYPANHIIGAAQVLVEEKGKTYLYTGDFKLDKTPIIKAEILVIEATYGNPINIRPFKKEVEGALIDIIKKEIKKNDVVIFAYHGKAQEAIKILNDAKLGVPILLSKVIYSISEICKSYGMDLGEYLLSNSPEARYISSNQKCIRIYHTGAWNHLEGNFTKIELSGWNFEEPIKQTGPKDYMVALSDHSDFKELIEYVAECNPKLVITDNYRIGDAQSLAREIKKRLNIEALPMPN
jgi:putative mRNA 3-end processing factor